MKNFPQISNKYLTHLILKKRKLKKIKTQIYLLTNPLTPQDQPKSLYLSISLYTSTYQNNNMVHLLEGSH
jgi:hypothetical protein